MSGIKAKSTSFWIKSLIFIVAAALLYYVLDKNKRLDEIYLDSLMKGWEKYSLFFQLVIFLVPINWSIESYKWQFLIKKLEVISFRQAIEGVIAGVTMGFVTPHSVGDYVARIFCLRNPDRAKGIGAVFLSRISQFYITLYFGTVALVFFVYKETEEVDLGYDLLIWFTVLNNILFVLIFIYHNKILKYIASWQFVNKIIPYFEIIKIYSFKEINFVMFLSFLRYSVFCMQFILVLFCFGIQMEWWLMLMGASFIFFIKSVVPTFLDLGVREAASVIFFGAFGYPQQDILFASLTIWLLNLVIPAILGLPLVYRIRFFNSEKEE